MDDISKVPGTALGRKYARMSGAKGMNGNYKLNLYNKMQAEVDHLKPSAPFKPKDVGEFTDGRKQESAVVRRFLGF